MLYQNSPTPPLSPQSPSAAAATPPPPSPPSPVAATAASTSRNASMKAHQQRAARGLGAGVGVGVGVGVPLLLLLSSLPREVQGTCRFPDFMQRDAPWAASYGLDARLVMYVKGTYMSVSQQADHRDTKYTRKCERRAPDNKFLVTHQEERQDPRYLCMQFLKRSENIVQMKVSTLSPRQSLELCDERLMAIDRWPIVQMSQTPEQKVTCPFMGGYNVNMYYPNDTELCTDSTLLMRIESECEKGEGIMFDFRQEECVPASLPRLTKQQAYCIAHWTQESQTFIILQHAEIHKQTWCLRISDPLSDIHSAHLMLDLVCDTGDIIRDTRNFFRLTMSRRVYASTCEDEIESDVCRDMKHLCKTHFKRHCARTCGTCQSESEMGDCAFEETYRGLWMESTALEGDKQLSVGAYSLNMERLGRYDCLKLEESKRHRDKRVLVRIDENGCYPRYACIEMEKISSSTMRFRLGDRHQWPLPQIRDRKDHVCAVEKNFLSRNAIESRFHVQRPPRLLVKESYINRVPCGLPRRLQNGIAFREEGQSCSGCLMYRPMVAQDRFVVRPHNCTGGRQNAALPQHSLTTIEYSCLAAFNFHNNTHAVVTKTNTYNSWGQYLCWVFTPDNYIKVIKAAETFLFEEGELVKQELLKAQFTIAKDDVDNRCQNVIAIATPPVLGAPSTTRRVPEWLVPYRGVTTKRGHGAGANTTYGPEVDVTYRMTTRGPNNQVEEPNSQGVGQSRGEDSSGSNPLLWRTRHRHLPLCVLATLFCLLLQGVELR